MIDTLRAGDQHDDRELSAIREQLAFARPRHEELADAVAAGTLSVVLAARSEPIMLAEIAKLEARENELATPNAPRPDRPSADAARRWDTATVTHAEAGTVLAHWTGNYIFDITRSSSGELRSPQAASRRTAIVQEFFRSAPESNPSTYILVRRRGSTCANRPATNANISSNPARHRSSGSSTIAVGAATA